MLSFKNTKIFISLLQNEDDDLYKRDFSAATLEDHFDKTILPKVMQVSLFSGLLCSMD